MKYCMHCGALLERHDRTQYSCTGCGYKHYLNPKAAVGIVLQSKHKNRVILARRGREPFKGALDVIGGFVDNGETLEQAAAREIEEEVGLTYADVSNLTYITSIFTEYEWMGKKVAVESIMFYAWITPGVELTPGDDIASVEEYDITQEIPDDFECDWMRPTLLAVKDYLDRH